MRYYRNHRDSIYHQATIGDIPFEVLREAFIYLDPKDLVSSSCVNRAWRPAAQDVQRSRLIVSRGGQDCTILYPSWFCGVQLSRFVYGGAFWSIKSLKLDIDRIDPAFIHILARLISSTLCTLSLDFSQSGFHYENLLTLEQFFSQCHKIRNLSITRFYFRDDPSSISQPIKEGFFRLSQLSLRYCNFDLQKFFESVPLPINSRLLIDGKRHEKELKEALRPIC